MISPHLQMALAHAKMDDLRRNADAYRLAHDRAQPEQQGAGQTSATLRLGSATHERPLARLAELDGCAPPALPVLLAEVDGQLRAALALTGGTVIADPFHPSAAIVQLLLARAAHLRTEPRQRGLLRRLLTAGTFTRRRQTRARTPAA